MSEVTKDTNKLTLPEDADDLAAFEERANDPIISFDDLVRELKRSGKIEDSAS